MEKEIRDAQFVLLVCTDTYLRRVMKEEEKGKGLGVVWESTIAIQHLYNAGVLNKKFIPIVFGRDNTKYIPVPLQPTTYYDVSTEEGYETLYRRLTDQPYTTKPKLGVVKKLAPRERKKATSKVEVSLAKLPSTSPDLFGREEKLKQLDDAWKNQDINVLSLVAWGGVGKTALVNNWLLQMAKNNYRGAERVYGWSFYSQGAAEGRQVSADQFIAAALTWFGDPDPTAGSPWDKGERLAELIKGQRTLMILDGLEPLQNPPPIETGRIKDPGLTSLLRELARQNPGLVVINTRLAVNNLKDFIGSTAIEIDLEALSDEAGAEYLKHLRVDGTDEECKEAAKDFAGHALALTLLGSYLKVVYHGDVRKYKEIHHLIDEQKQGAHAHRVMESYEHWLKGKPELDVLRLMGLFDRPAEKSALDILRKRPSIKGLTNSLQRVTDVEWQFTIRNLRDLRLLLEPDPNAPETLDCHPLLREYFAEKVRLKNPSSWHKAHSRLYEYYKINAKELPDTLEEMVPLYLAAMHGCQAGRYKEVLSEVYWQRIQRGGQYFNMNILGAISADLSILSGFFEVLWSKPIASLDEHDKGFLLHTAGSALHSIGHLLESLQPKKAAFNIALSKKDWKNAIRGSINLSDHYLMIADLAEALHWARTSVEIAEQNGDSDHQRGAYTNLGDKLHQMGLFIDAAIAFDHAEEIQKQAIPEIEYLVSNEGAEYCDLLLTQGKYAEVQRRAEKALGIVVDGMVSLHSTAMNHLSLGRAYLLQSQIENVGDKTKIADYLEQAVDGLRKSGELPDLPRGLLARAGFYRITGALDKAQNDLSEVSNIATRGRMGLHLADCHLEYTRLYLDTGDKEEALKNWKIAKDSIEKMGYHRRDKEVQELEKQLT